MKKKGKWFRRLLAVAASILIYPALVLGYTWTHVLRSDLEGGRHGPLDAYRHTLASAVVSNTLGKWAVELVTTVFESADKESNQMDRHNNAIGATIGASCATFGDIEPSVRAAVLAGAELADDTSQVFWLPSDQWGNARFW